MCCKNFILLIAIILTTNRVAAQKTDSICSLKFVQSLNVIKQYLNNNNSDTALKRVSAIHFLTMISGIPSESDGNYIGQLDPTYKDYSNWQNWYLKNRHKISCAKTQNKIKILE
jgi:hypothetical protein